jgi:hypothetical protein
LIEFLYPKNGVMCGENHPFGCYLGTFSIIVLWCFKMADGIGVLNLSGSIIFGWIIVIFKGWWRKLGEKIIGRDGRVLC